MNKFLPKFIHLAPTIGGSREIIIHTQKPRLIAEVTYQPDGKLHFKPTEFFDAADIETPRFSALLNRMSDWYHFTIINKNDDAH